MDSDVLISWAAPQLASFVLTVGLSPTAGQKVAAVTFTNINASQIQSIDVDMDASSMLWLQGVVYGPYTSVLPTVMVKMVTDVEVVSRTSGTVLLRTRSASSTLTQVGLTCSLSTAPSATVTLPRDDYDIRTSCRVLSATPDFVPVVVSQAPHAIMTAVVH
jgi:hypothetical protein